MQNEKKQLNHGDVLRIGANRFLVHIHPGRETCGQCEAVEIKAAIESVANAAASSDAQNSNEQSSIGTPMQKEAVRRNNADAVKIKYGLKKVRLSSHRFGKSCMGLLSVSFCVSLCSCNQHLFRTFD